MKQETSIKFQSSKPFSLGVEIELQVLDRNSLNLTPKGPDILALVWVGFDNGDSVFSTGSAAALPIWADLMNSIPQYVSESWYKMPSGVVKETVCSESGLFAHKGYTLIFFLLTFCMLKSETCPTKLKAKAGPQSAIPNPQ